MVGSSRQLGGWILDGSVAAIITFLFGMLVGAWKFSSIPPGWDMYWHAYKIKYILRNWPQISWDPQLAGGMLIFRQYPPAPFLLSAFIVRLTGVSIGAVMETVIMLSLIATAVFSYALVRLMTSDRHLGVLAAFLIVTAPGIWEWTIGGGIYARIIGFPFIPLTMLLTLAYVRSRGDFRLGFLPSILSASAGAALHIFTGLFALLGASSIILFASLPRSRRILLTLSLWVSTLALNAYLALPDLFLPKPPTSFYTGPTIEYLLRWAGSLKDTALPLTNFLFAAIVAAALLIKRLSTRLFQDKRLVGSFGLVVLVLLALLLVPRSAYSSSISVTATSLFAFLSYPDTSLVMLPFFLIPLLCALAQPIFQAMKRKKVILTLTLLILFLSSILFTQMSSPLVAVSRLSSYSFSYSDEASRIVDRLSVERDESNYRVAVQSWTDYHMYMWFPYYFAVPYTGDGGFSQGRLNSEQIQSFHLSVFVENTTLSRTKFYLDWWAVKWVLILRPHELEVQKFLNTPSDFAARDIGYRNITEVLYNAPRPMISSVSVPSILVIGPEVDAYERLFRGFSYVGHSDREAVPVLGGDHVDDYTSEELGKFSTVFLYGYHYEDRAKTWELLREYVQSGGNLVFDTGFSPDANADNIPEPSPVAGTYWTSSGTSWSFQAQDHAILSDVNLSVFGPAISGNDPWGYSATRGENIREWAKPVLWNAGDPVMVVGNYGRGRVVWLGLNLLYHADLYNNLNEFLFLSKIIDWASGPEPEVGASYVFSHFTPENVEIIMTGPSTGVLMKEFFMSDWRASVRLDSDETNTRIYRAGPGFMFVPVGIKTGEKATVSLSLDKSIEYAGLVLSVLCFSLLLADYLARGRLHNILAKVMRRWLSSVELRWNEEE